jgi:hypothetical protein
VVLPLMLPLLLLLLHLLRSLRLQLKQWQILPKVAGQPAQQQW